MEGSVSEDDNGGGSGNGGNGVRMRGDTEEAAAALVGAVGERWWEGGRCCVTV